MDLSIYDIIRRPKVTDKAYRENKDKKKLVLQVHIQANKPMIKEALEKLFNVKVKTVNTSIRKGKNKKVKRRAIKGSSVKTATVTLAEGYSLDLLEQSGAQKVVGTQTKAHEENKAKNV